MDIVTLRAFSDELEKISAPRYMKMVKNLGADDLSRLTNANLVRKSTGPIAPQKFVSRTGESFVSRGSNAPAGTWQRGSGRGQATPYPSGGIAMLQRRKARDGSIEHGIMQRRNFGPGGNDYDAMDRFKEFRANKAVERQAAAEQARRNSGVGGFFRRMFGK